MSGGKGRIHGAYPVSNCLAKGVDGVDGVLGETSQCVGHHGDALNPGNWVVGGELALYSLLGEASEKVCCWPHGYRGQRGDRSSKEYISRVREGAWHQARGLSRRCQGS